MNSSDLTDALRRDADLVGEPPGDLLERVEQLHRRSNRRRAGLVAAAAGAVLVVAAVPLLDRPDRPDRGSVAAPAGPTTPGVAEQHADLAAEFGIVDPPVVPVVELVTPERRAALVENCLAGRGWRLVEGAYVASEAQRADFSLANYVCMASYPIDPSYVGTPEEEDRIAD
ncbi:hypothetical protein [Blastococcus sp. LR1]|uniref:hypothetical protein n=1 Tax=Blastococcus sp. LR1 TaxID=2877000 RepID=UPI001CCEB154|nr:hypothetical protein [Blastococcus sp. LR1]MCA0145172.1 hypothetical protein [Blastococcus sp. LR1]